MCFWYERAIYVVRSGSHSHGTNLPTSDEDTRGVCVPPVSHILGLQKFEQHEDKAKDTVIYGLHKFVNLALACNPSIIELLHVREQDIRLITQSGRELRAAAPLFVTKRAFKTFGGYAFAQLRLLHRGKTARHGSHADLVEQFCYDCKNALHLIRLLRMGVEILETGQVHTYRPDREELLAIRRGEWSLERVLAEADSLDAQLKQAYETSTLPAAPDFRNVNNLVMRLMRNAFEDRL